MNITFRTEFLKKWIIIVRWLYWSFDSSTLSVKAVLKPVAKYIGKFKMNWAAPLWIMPQAAIIVIEQIDLISNLSAVNIILLP